jgi:hypothetical protein
LASSIDRERAIVHIRIRSVPLQGASKIQERGMKRFRSLLILSIGLFPACTGDGVGPSTPPGADTMSFFVTSTTSVTGNLGGLRGADERCQVLASAAGFGRKSWHAYLSVEHDADNGGGATNARDRIGEGPWWNANGVLVARDLNDLHARTGNPDVFVDETGKRIQGQWTGSPSPVQHDILTGSTAQGTVLAGLTCRDWTSSGTDVAGQVGHSDGLGPGGSTAGTLSSWNSAHANQNCADTAPRGGAGRVYCFARY